MALQHLRSSTANKRPVPGNMSDGQLGINTNTGSPGLFFKDSNNTLVKVGPVHVGTTAPNASPASGGTAGNSVGEQWLDTTGGTYVFKVWDGSAWRSESGTFVDVNGDTMTGALGIIAGSAGSPGLYVSGDTNTGLYSPGADQLALATGGSERLRITSAGLVGIGTTSPSSPLVVSSSGANGIEFLPVNGLIFTYNRSTLEYTNMLISCNEFVVGTNGGNERARFDYSGRLLVGTSSSTAEAKFIVQGGATGSGGGINIQRSVTTASAGSTIGFINFTNSSNNVGATVIAEGDGTWSAGTSHPTRLVFSTTADGASSPTERMRIDSTGRLFLNTTASPSTSSFGTAIGTVLAHSRDTSTGAVAQIYGSAGEFRIIGSGNAQNTNNSYGAISDQSLKTDISDAGSQWDDIKGITVRKFKLIGTDTLQIGVVAQECELVSPGLVEDTVLEQEDGTTSTVKAVKYSVLYMKAVKALQEAMERIEQLEQRLAAAGI